jgi:hypothetical protein
MNLLLIFACLLIANSGALVNSGDKTAVYCLLIQGRFDHKKIKQHARPLIATGCLLVVPANL